MIGSVLANKYKIKSIVGIGGMAVVYKAYRITDNKVVAVKVLNDEYRRKPDYVRRFESEARAVMSLSHPNIIGLLDVGIDGDAPFIVLEFATGKTLKEIIDENGPLSQGFAVKIISQVLSALAHAHEKGVIHRDIKPQNIIVTAGGIVHIPRRMPHRKANGLRHSKNSQHVIDKDVCRKKGARLCTLHFTRAGKRRGCNTCLRHLFYGNNAIRNGYGQASV